MTFVAAHAKFVAPKVVESNGKQYTADTILIATGGYPYIPNIPVCRLMFYFGTACVQLCVCLCACVCGC